MLAKLAAVAKEVVVAARYGAGPVIGGYVFIFNVVSWPIAVWTSVLSAVLLPLLIKLSVDNPDELNHFRREFFGAAIWFGSAIAVVMGALLFVLLSMNVFNLVRPVDNAALEMLIPGALIVPLGFYNSALAVRLMALHRYTNSLLDGMPAMGIMISVLLFPSGRADAIIWGTVVGYVAQLILLIAAQPAADRFDKPELRFRAAAWNNFFRFAGIVLGGQILIALAGVIDQAMVGHLGPTANATLGYSARLLALVTTLGATAVTRAMLPVFTELRSISSKRAFRVAVQWSRLMFLVGLGVVALGWICAHWGVALLFQRGAFTAYDTEAVVQVFRISLLQLPLYFAGMVVLQLILSHTEYDILLYIGLVQFVVKFAGNFLLIPILGISGAPAATALMYAFSLAALLFAARWRAARRERMG